MSQVLENVRQSLADWWQQLGQSASEIAIGLLILILGLYLARWLRNLVARGLQHRRTDAEISLVIARIVQWGVVTIAILVSADQVGLDITAFLTGIGILGFTVGFALQDVSKNFVAGMLILIQQPFELGDTIEVSGFTGTVLNINLRDTEMRTADGLRVRIPNGDVFTSPILNYTDVASRRLELAFGVAYGSDLEVVRQASLAAIRSVPGVLDDPAVDFRFEAFTDYAIQVRIYYWYSEAETGYSAALNGGITALNAAFKDKGIEIAVPYQRVQISEIPGRKT